MKKLIFALSIIFVFGQCTKKASDAMSVNTSSVDHAWRNKAPIPAPARDIQLGTYSSFDLENGLKVIVVENHKLPRVSYQLSLNNDPMVEGDKAGYTSFAGDLISKGTKTRSKAQIDEAIDFIGASMNTSAGGVFGSSLKKHSGKLLEVMTDVLNNPTFPEDEFEKLRKRTASNLSAAKSNPDAIASNIRTIVNYGANHPYGEVETDETIKNIQLADCKKYYDTYFRPNNAYMVIVGDITPAEAKSQADKYFGSWKKGTLPISNYDIPTGPKGRQIHFGNKDGAVQSVISVSYPVVMKPGNPDAIKASLTNFILGGNFSSRLMQNLREKRAYTYGARSSISNDKLVGNFNAGASVRNEVTDSSLTELLYEMNRIATEPVSENDLATAKSSMTGNFAQSLESPQTVANFAFNTFRYNLPKDYYNNYLKNLDAVTIQDVQDMAKKYIHADNCNIIVVGNKDNVADKIKKFDSDGKIDFYDPFGKKLEESNMELSADISAQSVINDYLEAIGGMAKLKEVKSIYVAMKTSLMGQDALFETFKVAPDKFAMKINMMGSIVQEQKFDGKKGMTAQMGQKNVVTDGKDFDELKKQSIMFDQMVYNTPAYKMELKGVENVEGQNCYKILITESDGSSTTEFYDVKTNFLIRNVKSQGGPDGQSMSITTDFKDYKEVGGIMMPYLAIITGAMPVPLNLESVGIEINKPMPDDTFKIE
ncbi:MAG: pitrilysin family protein [Saprospiraceae bacterium]